MHHRAAALSDIGLHRRENEDRYLCDNHRGLFGVADGIGGLPHGALAAETAIEAVGRLVAHTAAQRVNQNLELIISSANNEVLQLGRQMSPLFGIGTTLTFGLLAGDSLRLAHVGDSRCYLLSKDRLTRLTTDHNVENEHRHRRERGETVDESIRNRAALTRCIGQWTTPIADLSVHALEPGDRCLFCTDGLTRAVEDAELAEALSGTGEPERILRDLVQLANRRGGFDNATAVLLLTE